METSGNLPLAAGLVVIDTVSSLLPFLPPPSQSASPAYDAKPTHPVIFGFIWWWLQGGCGTFPFGINHPCHKTLVKGFFP